MNTPSGLAGVRLGKGAWGDYKNDGRLDAVLVGSAKAGNVAEVWRNSARGPAIPCPPRPPA